MCLVLPIVDATIAASMMGVAAEKKRPCIELLDDRMVAVLRGKTATERVAMVFDAERRHPEWSPSQIAAEIARRRRLGSS
jgi:hypothetical protein